MFQVDNKPIPKDQRQVNRELQRLGLGHLKDPNLIANMAFLIRDHGHFRGILMHMPMPDRKEAYECLAPKLRFKAKSLEDYEIESRNLAEQNQLPQYDPKTLEAKEWSPQEFKTSRFDEPAECTCGFHSTFKPTAGVNQLLTKLALCPAKDLVSIRGEAVLKSHQEALAETDGFDGASKLSKIAERAISTDLREATANQQLTLVCRACTFEQSWRVKRRSSAYKLARQDGWLVDKHTALCRNCKPKAAIH